MAQRPLKASSALTLHSSDGGAATATSRLSRTAAMAEGHVHGAQENNEADTACPGSIRHCESLEAADVGFGRRGHDPPCAFLTAPSPPAGNRRLQLRAHRRVSEDWNHCARNRHGRSGLSSRCAPGASPSSGVEADLERPDAAGMCRCEAGRFDECAGNPALVPSSSRGVSVDSARGLPSNHERS